MKSPMTWIGLVLVSVFCINAFANAADGSGASVLSASRLNNGSDKTNQIGIGAQVGSFTGVNTELWMTNYRAFTASVTFRDRNSAFTFGHNWFPRETFSGSLVPFIGVGGLAVFGNGDDAFERHRQTFAFGLQVPVGMEFLPLSQRFSFFAELAPGVEVAPIGVGFITGDLGARFYF